LPFSDDGIVLSDGCTTNGGEGITEPRGGISIGGEGDKFIPVCMLKYYWW